MNSRSVYVALAALCMVMFFAGTAVADNCVDAWIACRNSATVAYFNDDANTWQYALLLTGCDMGYGRCVITPV